MNLSMSQSTETVFDSVCIADTEPPRELDRAQFVAIPIRDRIQLLLAGQVSFFLAGEKVAATLAMKSLRDA